MKVEIDGKLYVPAPKPSKGKNLKDALNLRFEECDAGDNITVRDYLRRLLEELWCEKECFSGKRPFGNSGWDYDLYTILIVNGFIKGELDEDGYIKRIDSDADANDFVLQLIRACFEGK